LPKTDSILAVDIQALILMSVVTRFGGIKAPRKIQWLSDRVGIYLAGVTQEVAQKHNLVPNYTVAYGPDSNRMAETLVQTIKRDNVYVNDCLDPVTVLGMLTRWFEDYNKVTPHCSL